MIDSSRSTYYLENLEQFLGFYDILERQYGVILAYRFGKEKGDLIIAKMKGTYRELMGRLTFIGSDDNYLTQALVGTVPALALYKVLLEMKETENPAETAGTIYLEAIERAFQSQEMGMPSELQERGAMMFSPGVYSGMRKMAENSQQKKYDGDFVYHFIEGNGSDFDFGFDFTECAVCKFFHKENADELTPYMCRYDFIESRACNTGLMRTKTLAEGQDRCDFRYKKPGA
jgi:hypothetical protein